MNIQKPRAICLTPVMRGVGGMVSFQGRLEEGLRARGYEVTYDLRARPCTAVLVIGGTRQIGQLYELKRHGVRIIQRLNGMNWLHRKFRTGVRHYIRSIYGNQLLALIRNRLADRIVYQSNFAQGWWEKIYGRSHVDQAVIYNGVNLNTFSPNGTLGLPHDRVRILMVEGSLMGGYEIGLESGAGLAINLAERNFNSHSHFYQRPVELMVVGRVTDPVRINWSNWIASQSKDQRASIAWVGQVPNEQIPDIDRSAHLFYSADLNAACPNSVIEAMACGTPVVAYDTGALPELLAGQGGRIAPYGGDPWELDSPDTLSLVEAAQDVLVNNADYRSSARARAVAAFDSEIMVERYLNFLLDF